MAGTARAWAGALGAKRTRQRRGRSSGLGAGIKEVDEDTYLSIKHGADEVADLLGVFVMGPTKRRGHAGEAFMVGNGAFGAGDCLSLALHEQVRFGVSRCRQGRCR